ncbi:CIA30 family protein [Lutibacter sp. A80]|uniref:CIA30 family protein n=1 Tax=Lutibacter sp. A80 TaxID=2918453 RepID=UPI001F058EC4|nr:CIA30 family protein [Lutibacter sp. A80]UMB60720.1 CIA30 family protein [Lutibacter sp. A80]
MLTFKYVILMTLMLDSNYTIVNFTKNTMLYDWVTVTDVVMGGQSTSTISINAAGNALFKGSISLENNGGFSLLRHRFQKLDISQFNNIKLRLKGDGKMYQFRIKPSRFHQYAYIYNFKTNGEWQTIELNLTDFQPAFRGRNLDMPNFSGNELEEIGFLIGNKLSENFELVINSIVLE